MSLQDFRMTTIGLNNIDKYAETEDRFHSLYDNFSEWKESIDHNPFQDEIIIR